MKSTPRVPTLGPCLHLLKNGEGIYVSKLVYCWFAYFHSTSANYTMPALLQKVQAEILLLFANFQSIPSYIKQFCCANCCIQSTLKMSRRSLVVPLHQKVVPAGGGTWWLGEGISLQNLKPPAWQKRLERHHQSIDSHRVCLVSSLANSGKICQHTEIRILKSGDYSRKWQVGGSSYVMINSKRPD